MGSGKSVDGRGGGRTTTRRTKKRQHSGDVVRHDKVIQGEWEEGE